MHRGLAGFRFDHARPGGPNIATGVRPGYGPRVRRSPLRFFSEEARTFNEALDAAPAPELTRDLWGIRTLLYKLGWLLWHEKTSPRHLAAAVFLGVFVGCSPFYGLHSVLVLALGFVLRLNKIVIWVASNVSLPFIAPFIAFASMHVGHWVLYRRPLPMTLQGARDIASSGSIVEAGVSLWLYWLVGSLFVGSVLGVVLAATTYVIAKRREAAQSPLGTGPSQTE